MKKFLAIFAMLSLIVSMPVFADNAKDLEKALKREKKEKMKEYKKDGWKVFGTSRTLEVSLLQHYDNLAQLGENGSELMGVATKCKSKNVGTQMALNNACITYAQRAGSQLAGRVVSDIAGDGSTAESEFEHFYAAYERMVEKEIRGEIQESYSIIHDNGDGTYEIQSYFIVNEDAAARARMRALENAAKESAAAQKHADLISSFVREKVAQ